MTSSPAVSNVRFRRAFPGTRATGLLGWATFEVAGLRIDGVQVRRTKRGRTELFYPEHMDSGRGRHTVVWPLADDARAAIEGQVIGTLRRRGELP